MPNPLTRASRNRSKGIENPKPIEPKPEHYDGHNNAYRGIENHGVDSGIYLPVPVWTEDDKTVVNTQDSTTPDPIPVRIVDHAKREVQAFNTTQVAINKLTPTLIAGADNRRVGLVMKALSTIGGGSWYIGSDMNVTEWTGYQVASTTEMDDKVPAESAVYALLGSTAPADTVNICVISRKML